MLPSHASLYWQSIRHLRPIQVYRRVWFRIARPRPDLSSAPAFRRSNGAWLHPARRRPSLIGATEFRLLGVSGCLSDVGWDGSQREKLWRYNQHYFDDLNASGADGRRDWHRALLVDWVNRNPPGRGNGWEPYPTSLRIVNWLKWMLAGNPLPPECTGSLAVQVRWLLARLEWHILGNHLFANAKALVFAGLAFEGPEPSRWLDTGLRILRRQLPEQVLADGGNFELSTMYHAIFLEDLLDLINASEAWPGRISAEVTAEWRAAAARMLAWLRTMRHPDGEIAFFNDAALGVAPTPAEIEEYASRLNVAAAPREAPGGQRVTIVHLDASGYVRVDAGRATAILDVAKVGPDYIPGHAHADTLSFELSVAGHRLFVNGGTSCYGVSEQRLRQRQTRSHSTVEIDGEDSSEVWRGFRVARRAYPFDLSVHGSAEQSIVACSHDGYARLPGRPIHRREWRIGLRRLDVVDSVVGQHRRAVARYLLHPGVKIAGVDGRRHFLLLPNGDPVVMTVMEGSAKVEPGNFAPEFGTILTTSCIAVQLQDGRAHVACEWA